MKLYTEEKLVSEALGNIERLVESINTFALDLKQEGGTLTKGLLNGFLEKPDEFLTTYFFDGALKDLKLKASQVNSALKSGIWKGAEEASKKLLKHQPLIQDAANRSQIEVSQLSITAGKASVSDKLREEITEQFSYFLAPEDEELFNRLQKFLEYLTIENGYVSATATQSLLHNLKVVLTEASLEPADHPFKSLVFREELLIVKDGGLLIPNPRFFNERAKQPKTTKNANQKVESEHD